MAEVEVTHNRIFEYGTIGRWVRFVVRSDDPRGGTHAWYDEGQVVAHPTYNGRFYWAKLGAWDVTSPNPFLVVELTEPGRKPTRTAVFAEDLPDLDPDRI